MGGQKNRRFEGVDLKVAEITTSNDLCKVMDGAIHSLLSGELQAREAIALTQLCNSFHRFITTAELEVRVTRLEKMQLGPQGLTGAAQSERDLVADGSQTETTQPLEVEEHGAEASCATNTNSSDRTGSEGETESTDDEFEEASKP